MCLPVQAFQCKIIVWVLAIDRQTDTQNDYCNPRCACAPRVNYRSACYEEADAVHVYLAIGSSSI